MCKARLAYRGDKQSPDTYDEMDLYSDLYDGGEDGPPAVDS